MESIQSSSITSPPIMDLTAYVGAAHKRTRVRVERSLSRIEDFMNDLKEVSIIWSFFLIFNIISIIIGCKSTDCSNGTEKFLLYSGVLGLVVSVLSRIFIFLTGNAGEMSLIEGCALGPGCFFYWFMQLAILFTQLFIMVWGLAVIIPAYLGWIHDDGKKVIDGHPNPNYCSHVPMMYALVLLIIKWALFILAGPPLVCYCCCTRRRKMNMYEELPL